MHESHACDSTSVALQRVPYLELLIRERTEEMSNVTGVRNGTGQGDTRGLGRLGGVGLGRDGRARSDGGARPRGRGEVVVSR